MNTRSPWGSVDMESGSVRVKVAGVTGGLRLVAFASPGSAGVSTALVPDSVTLTMAGAGFFPALLSVGLDADIYAAPFTNPMSSKPPPQDVFGTAYWVGVLLAGLIVYSRGFPSSLVVTHIWPVAGSIRMPSACPITLHVFSNFPLLSYPAIVLGLVVEPSLAEEFCQPIHTLPPT